MTGRPPARMTSESRSPTGELKIRLKALRVPQPLLAGVARCAGTDDRRAEDFDLAQQHRTNTPAPIQPKSRDIREDEQYVAELSRKPVGMGLGGEYV